MGYAERSKGFIDPVRQFGQLRACLDAREKGPGITRIGEISEARNGDLKAAAETQIFKHIPEFLKPLLRPRANELARDVQIFQRRPFQRRKGAQFPQHVRQVVQHVRSDRDPCKQPHRRLFCHVMPRVRIVHWKAPQAGPLIEACRACGFEVEYHDLKFADLAKMIRAKPPDALVIDLTCLPSHGRDTAIYLRRTKYARSIPLVFVDGEPEKVDNVRQQLPDATFTSRKRLCAGIKQACAKGVPADTVLPPGAMERYGSRTLAQKLGIKEGSTVGVMDAPRDYAAALGALPEGVEIVEDPASAQSVTLWFVRDPREYQAGLRRMHAIAHQTKLWIVWRKGTGVLTDRSVREAANDAGLVDYKICAVNAQWSAMAFARRKS